MRWLRNADSLRTMLAVLMIVVGLSPALDARQVSPPPGTGTARDCEAERGQRYQKAWQEYQDSLASIDRKKAAAIQSCQDSFNKIDIPDCARKYDSQMKVLLASVGTGTMVCAAMCVVVVTPAGATVAPSCATCIGALYTVVAGGFVKAVTDLNDCVKKATDVESKCGADAVRAQEVSIIDAAVAYRRKLIDADNLYDQCKAATGG